MSHDRNHRLDFLAGGGEMGARMRSFDWSKTPLGPVEHWPQSLRTSVSICLNSQFPINMAWGPDLVLLYNDAFIPILGSKHPQQALGIPNRDCFREIWSTIGPMLEGVLQTGTATWSEDLLLPLERSGYLEECYFTFSYSPIRDESGGVGGVFIPVKETTENVITERRLTTLRELADRGSKPRTVADACRVAVETLARNPFDVSFVSLYIQDGQRLTLAGAAGIAIGTPLSASVIDLAANPPPVFAGAMLGKRTEAFPRHKLGALPEGIWAAPPEEVIVTPTSFGEAGGFLIAGVNPRKRLDADYRRFLALVAGQIGDAITAATNYEQERKRAEALAELNRAKTIFFSNISHEFRTPLTLMLGPEEDALRSPTGALAGDSLRVVHRNTLRLLKLVNALLDFSRMEAGRMQACFQPVELAALTRELAGTFRAAIERAGLAYEVDCEEPSEPIYIDPNLWERIVLNLLSNAFKFTFDGRVRVSLREDSDLIRVVVADTGVGMPAAELPRVFERFHRIEGTRARTYEGSGIGLALVHDLVALHGGAIDVASEPGRGTTFTILLRKGTAHLPPDCVTAAAAVRNGSVTEAFVAEAMRWLADDVLPDTGPVAKVNGDARVLVVDDNADMRDYLGRLLREQGWYVETVPDGASALRAAHHARPDLVLTDVMMPNLDGFGLLRELRGDARTREIPVIMLSARAGEESRVEGLHAGADDYLVKPFSARELVARVATHLQLASLRHEASAAGERLFDLFMQSPIAISVTSGPEHHFELANAAYERLVGRSITSGKRLAELFPELVATPMLDLIDTVYRTGEPFSTDEYAVTLERNGERAEGVFSFNMIPIRDASGAVTGIMSTAVEVTEQVRIRRALEASEARARAARAEAERSNRAKDEFLAMLGHELRNPLAPIVTALQLMRLRGGDAIERERSVIERHTEHLIHLVDDLLDVSRITRGKVDLKRSRVELAPIVARAIEMASPLLEQRRHDLKVDVAKRGLSLSADPARLAQVIANLVTNAAKYTEPGGHITVSASRDNGEIELVVKDTGIGIEPDMLPRVFDMFVQEPQSLERSHGGLGLGLSIVRTLVSLHGGTVTAHSAGRGCGSTFTIRLPAVPRADATPTPPAVPVVRAEGTRILVVDDNEDTAQMLAETLEAMGNTTKVAYDGPAALRVAEEFQPDLALLDIGLPVMDGYELAHRLREQVEHRIRLVAVTGYSQDTDRQRSQEAGFDEHLVKPLNFERLRRIVEALGQRERT